MTTALKFPKPLRRRDREYLRFIRRQGCLVCKNRALAHHVKHGGVGTKGSDYDTVPLCFIHHDVLHVLGAARFQRELGVNFTTEVQRLNRIYREGEAA
jgi:hypothetical protein